MFGQLFSLWGMKEHVTILFFNKSFFRFKGNFFQNVGNGHSLLVKSPKLPVGLSFGRCRPGLTGISHCYPLFSKRSCQKKPRNVTFLGFVYLGFYAGFKR